MTVDDVLTHLTVSVAARLRVLRRSRQRVCRVYLGVGRVLRVTSPTRHAETVS